MGHKLTIIVFLIFISTFVYFGREDDDHQSYSTGTAGVNTIAEQTSEPSNMDKTVAMVAVVAFFLLYSYCPLFRDCVNVIAIVCLGGSFLKRLGGND